MRLLTPHIIGLFTILLAVVFAFWDLPSTFFQQDEWQYFGSSIYALSSAHPVANVILPLQGQVTHFFPLATLFFLWEYIVFRTNFPPYAIVNIFFHTLNAVLLYVLVAKLTQKKVLAWGASLLFAVNSIAHQPISWVAAGIGTLPGTFFLLFFFLGLLLSWQTKKTKLFLLSFLSLVVSILFKETALFVFVLFPIVWLGARIIIKRPVRIPKIALAGFIVVGSLYVLLRAFFLLAPIRSEQPEIGDVAVASPLTYLYRAVTTPLKAIPQSIILFPIIREIADVTVHLAYPKFVAPDKIANPYVTESIVFDLITYVSTVIFLLTSYAIWLSLRKREPAIANMLVLSFAFIAASAMPFIFIPGKAGFFSIFEPRNLYVIGIGSSLWITIVLYSIGLWTGWRRNGLLFTGFFIALLALFHSLSIRADIQKFQEIGTIRKRLITTVKEAYPKLPSSVIVYTESDRTYYGLAEDEKILPVQSGFGRMVMVWYQDKEKFPGCLYEQQFLHDLISEGYKVCAGRGFGYARNYTTLLKLMRENHLPSEDILAFSWDGTKKEFRDTTLRIREDVGRDLRL